VSVTSPTLRATTTTCALLRATGTSPNLTQLEERERERERESGDVDRITSAMS
jgi:hypothetical protein